MELSRQIKLVNTLNSNTLLRELVKKLQLIKDDKNIDANETIKKLDLPLNYHLFITANYSDLMQIKFNS